MEVRVKVSLQGGHTWEFCCDDGDPMVTGLVSALPGAAIDPTLPPDGLIQLETRSGEKLFVTRSSLVAVAVVAVDSASAPSGSGYGFRGNSRSGAMVPTPFVLLPECFGAAARAALWQAIPGAKSSAIAAGIRELEFSPFPEEAVSDLIVAMEEASAVFALAGEDDRHLDVRLQSVEAGTRRAPTTAAHGDDLLAFLAVLPLEGEGSVFGAMELADQITTESSRPGSVRDVTVQQNSILVYPPQAGFLRLTSDLADAIIVSGSLRRGAAVGSS